MHEKARKPAQVDKPFQFTRRKLETLLMLWLKSFLDYLMLEWKVFQAISKIDEKHGGWFEETWVRSCGIEIPCTYFLVLGKV